MKRQKRTKRADLRKRASRYQRTAEWCKMVACDYYLTDNIAMEQYWESEYRRFTKLAIETQEEVLRLYDRFSAENMDKKRKVTAQTAKSKTVTTPKRTQLIIPRFGVNATPSM